MVNKLNDGVGKKIVEALKKQSEGEQAADIEEKTSVAFDGLIPNIEDTISSDVEEETLDLPEAEPINEVEELKEDVFEESNDDIFSSVESQEEEVVESNSFDSGFDSFFEEPATPLFNVRQETTELQMPANILILKKLIAQLPSGVTRHTGAQIIKQTMEALGISMKSVLKEAQEVQDGLKDSAKECQANIVEYKKQIATLEKQCQSYQKQYGALNDLISLFIQTTK